MEDNKLNVMTENGNMISIVVIDIIESVEFNREYIIYSLDNDEEDSKIYASILEEDETSYTLKTIESDEEWKYVDEIINRLAEEDEEDDIDG